MQWLEKALHAIQIDHALDKNNEKILLSLLYIFFGWQMLWFALVCYILWNSHKLSLQRSRGWSKILKFLDMSALTTTFLLALPIFQIYLTILICVDERQVYGDLVCYKGMYFLHFFIAFVGIIAHIVLSVSVIIFSSDINPFSNVSYATPQNKPQFFKLWIKLLLTLFALLAYKNKSINIIVYFYVVLWLGVLVYRWRQRPDFHKFNYFFKVGGETFLLWFIIYELVRLGINEESDDASISLTFFLCCPFIIYGINHIIKQRAQNIRIKQIKGFGKDIEAQMYIYIVIDLIKKRKNALYWMELEGLVKHHIRYCIVPSCCCLQLSNSNDELGEKEERVWYRWVQSLIEDALEKFPKSVRLHLLSAFVQHVKLKNTFKALYEIEMADSLNKTAEEDMTCFSYKTLIESEIVENDEKEKETRDNEWGKAMAFHEGFTELKHLLSETMTFYIDFWSELLEASPYFARLFNSGSQVIDHTDVIVKKYDYLTSINSNYIRLHQAYGDFTKIVLPESNESSKAFERLANESTVVLTKDRFDTNNDLLDENLDRFIIMSGNYKNMGLITDIAPGIPEMFGYSKSELMNRSVNILMPKVFAEVHDRILKSYLSENSEKTHDSHKSRIIFPINKDGYIIPCQILVYILPSLREGVRLAGFLKEIDAVNQNDDFNESIVKKAPYYIIFDADTQLLQGVSENCWKSFGISSRLVEGNEDIGDVGVEDLFMNFGKLDLEKLKSEEGAEAILDTSKLSQHHFISEQAFKEIEDQDQEEEVEVTRFREAYVMIKMIAEADYFGNRFQVFRFTEVNHNNESCETQRVKSPKLIKKHDLFASAHGKNEQSEESQEEEDAEIGEGSVETGNEELKILKDIRILFANKEKSRAMKVLMVVLGMFVLLIIGLGIFQLVMIKKQIQEFSDILGNTTVASVRHRTFGDLTNGVVQYQALSLSEHYMPAAAVPGYTAKLQAKIETLSAILSGLEIQMIQATLAFNDTSFVSIDKKYFTFELFLDSGVMLQKKLFVDGYFQYMAAVDQVKNASLASLRSPQSSVDPGTKSLSYVVRNGYGPLREGAEMMRQSFENYFAERRDYYGDAFLVILIITEIIIAIAAVISVPFGFAAYQTNDKIISLFGYIPGEEMELMIEKAERFREEYLEPEESADAAIYEDVSFAGPGAGNSVSHINPSAVSQEYNSKTPNDSQMDESERQDVDENLQSPQLNVLTLSARSPTTGGLRQTTMDLLSARDPLNTNSARFLLTQRQQLSERNEDDDLRKVKRRSIFDNEKDRSAVAVRKINDYGKIPKYIRAEKGNRRLVIFVVTIGTLFWVLVFIFSYTFFERWFLDEMRKIYAHATTNAKRNSALIYTNAFILEEIVNTNTTKIYDYPGKSEIVNLRSKYRQLAEEMNSNAMDDDILDLPSTFSDYINIYKETTLGNICPYYSNISDQQTVCEQYANGVNKNGIRMAVLSNLLFGDSFLKDFKDQLSLLDPSNTTAVSSLIAKKLVTPGYFQLGTAFNFMSPAMAAQRNLFMEAGENFFNYCQAVGVAEFVGYVVMALLMFAGAWYQSSKGLGNRIIKSKRMLNMIPLELVLNNELLKEKVLSQDIHRVLI